MRVRIQLGAHEIGGTSLKAENTLRARLVLDVGALPDTTEDEESELLPRNATASPSWKGTGEDARFLADLQSFSSRPGTTNDELAATVAIVSTALQTDPLVVRQ